MTFCHISLRVLAHVCFFCLALHTTEPIWTHGINTLMPRFGKLWKRRTSKRWLVAVTVIPQIIHHLHCCPHICVSPPAGEPAASLAAVGGDGERRELLCGGTAASLCGPSPAAQQQGANCGNVFVGLIDGKCSVMPVTVTPVTHSPVLLIMSILFSHRGISL